MQITITAEKAHIQQILRRFQLTDFQKELVTAVWEMMPNNFYNIAKLITAYETNNDFPNEKLVLLNRKLLIRYIYQSVLNA